MDIGIYGFGSIGRLLAKYAIERGYNIVGVYDIDKSIIGKDIGELIGLSGKYGVEVSSDPLDLVNSDVVYHATSSYLDTVYPQLIELIDMGVDVISTCETLAYPYYRYPVLARKLDEYARLQGVSILGTGVNPGFVLDTLVITLSAVLTSIKRIVAIRSLDAGKRRASFRKKIGVGDRYENVREKLEKGVLTGHVGYAESIYLISEALGIELTNVIEKQEPVIADDKVSSHGIVIDKGFVKGIIGYGLGYVGDREVIRIELHAYVGAEDYEEIIVEGDYSIKWRSTGIPGDQGTVAVLLNLGERIGMYGPGLLLMTDLLPYRLFAKITV
ncbi:MAG: dihydrodipicolinate reductase [Desulfurococcaceae archaeon]|uniref:Dihydrodipicolinate reductase n=1 Tax=Staphylothermus marinus TaxID=2280 RepID=A0A7C4H9C6_STAMA